MSPSELVQQIFAPLLSGTGCGASPQDFVAVPGTGAPRWLIPVHNGRARATMPGWSPYRLSSRLKWTAIRAASVTGLLSVLPGAAKVSMTGLPGIDWWMLGWDRVTSPIPFVYVGTTGPRQKAVVHLVDPASDACRAVVKFPLTDGAKRAIVHEADTLNTILREGFGCAPKLLYVDRERGIASQTAICGAPGRRKFAPSYFSLLKSLRLPGACITLGAALRPTQALLPTLQLDAREFAVSWEALSRSRDETELPSWWVHGDFAPWNIRQMQDGTTMLLDWEFVERGGLPLQDGLHFMHVQDFLFGGRPTLHFADLSPLASPLGLSPMQCRELEIAYLLRSFLEKKEQLDHRHSRFLLSTLEGALRGAAFHSSNKFNPAISTE